MDMGIGARVLVEVVCISCRTNTLKKKKGMSQKICNNFKQDCGAYISRPKHFNQWKARAVVGSIVINGALTRYAFFYSVYNLSPISQLQVIKNICHSKGENIISSRIVTRLCKKIRTGCKNIDAQARPGRSKIVNSRMCSNTYIEANPTSNIRHLQGFVTETCHSELVREYIYIYIYSIIQSS